MTKRQQRKLERLRKKEARLNAKAEAAAAKADAFSRDSDTETATVTAGGRQQEVKISKAGSKARNQRLKALEIGQAKAMAEIEALRDELDAKDAEDQDRMQGNMLLSDAAIGGLRALVALLNAGDAVQNTGAYVAATSLDALADAGGLEDDQAKYARIGSLVMQALAYYNPDLGFSSIVESDKPVEIDDMGMLPSADQRVVELERELAFLRGQLSTTAVGAVSGWAEYSERRIPELQQQGMSYRDAQKQAGREFREQGPNTTSPSA